MVDVLKIPAASPSSAVNVPLSQLPGTSFLGYSSPEK